MKAVQARARVQLKNILFATDFSTAANAAAPFAIQIAKTYGAKVYGLHVNLFDDYTSAAPEAWAMMAEAQEKQAKEHAQLLNEQLAGIDHEVMIGQSNIWEVVSKFIEDKKIDLIVLGTRGRTGLGKALLGSVAETILRLAPCPVLTVGPHVTLQPEKAAKMREILYATDLAADSPVATPYAISLAQENQAHLALLYVMEEPEGRAKVSETKVPKLRQLVPEEAALWCEPHYLVEQGIPAEKILQVADQRHADLIVLGAQPARWLSTHVIGGTVHKVISEAKCPVLTVHG